MNWTTVRIILRHELRMLLRYRRTVLLAVILPLVTVPLILFTASRVEGLRDRSLVGLVYRYALAGPDAAQIRDLIEQGKGRMRILPKRGEADAEMEVFACREIRTADPKAALAGDKIHFYLQMIHDGGGGMSADAVSADATIPPELQELKTGGNEYNGPSDLRDMPRIGIFFMADREDSRTGQEKMKRLLLQERRIRRDAILMRNGFPVAPAGVIPVETRDLASQAKVTGSYLGRFLTLIMLFLLMGGASIVAIDSIAGEKERGSLETLLSTAAGRVEIVAAKQILILAVALFIAGIQVANLLVYVTLNIIELPKEWILELPPAVCFTLLALFIPFAAFVASALLLLSAYAKTYKEAQLYFFPVSLVCMIPSLAAVLPGISLRSAIAAVPIANVSVAVREIMVGKFDWPMIGVTLAVMTLAAGLTIRAAARMLTQEQLITANEMDAGVFTGGPSLFPGHVLRWFAVMGAVMFAAALNLPQLSTLQGQMIFNELVLFLGASMLMIRWYRLDPREALALRPVRPMVWIAVLVAIPSGSLTASGVFRLAGLIFPMPDRILEQFAREILPPGMPVWQLIFFVAVLPGLCEEIAFRGLLLHGLRRKFRPVTLTLVVGFIFGLFHVALFRILPTAFMGVALTAMALLTGSIFPGMVAHMGNNALALLAGTQGISLGTLDWWVYAFGAGFFALSFVILYHHRTPYPGLLRPVNK